MFGEKAAEIKRLNERVVELEQRNLNLMRENCKLGERLEARDCRLRDLAEELAMIKPVFETPGFKPAISMKCEHCKFAYFSDYDGSLLGCCKDVVCEEFEAINRKSED